MKPLLAMFTALFVAASIHAQSTNEVQQAPLAPDATVKAMTMPPGFKVTLFAAEPDVRRPIGFCVDDRGRLWVAESYSYPNWAEDGHDRILVFEDTDGDGHFDKRTVFYDKLHFVSGVQVGFGGVWISDAPNLLFIPCKEGDVTPSGPPQVVLDGWDNIKAQHNMFNDLTWGPDGWLYGCNGIQSHSNVGHPGAMDAERVKIDCGVWRYHPTKKIFEAFSFGTTNPFGLDFDEHGQAFISNCVIPHLFHMIQGAHFQRMYGNDLNPYVYSLMKTCADHLHWGGGEWTSSRGGEGVHSAAGGGHAHSGAMFYLADAFPGEYRGTIMMHNIHGNRINNDGFERKGSGVVAKHRPDFVFTNDKWNHGAALQQGPDGSVYFSNWEYTGECHAYHIPDTLGRLYKLTYGNAKPGHTDLTKLSAVDLVKLQLSRDEWLVRHSRRILQERGPNPAVQKDLLKILDGDRDPIHKLHALWTLHAIGGLTENILLAQLASPDDYIRSWTIQLLAEDKKPSQRALEKLAALAKSDPSPTVRLYLASAMQRTPVDQRWPVLEALVAHAADADDQNLPLMYWYAMEAAVGVDADKGIALAEKSKIPLLREYITRRVASLTK